jgi:type IV secretion system protein VirB4
LPNERAIEPQILATYRRFGLNDRQIEIIARATPKRDYYCQSRRGNRLFELGLGDVALALCAASSKTDQNVIADISAQLRAEREKAGASGTHDTSVSADHSTGNAFAAHWLRHRGLVWAADLLPRMALASAADPGAGNVPASEIPPITNPLKLEVGP